MTQVAFSFVTPTGLPLADTLFTIQLKEADTVNGGTGVIMPRQVEVITDVNGEVTLDILASDTLYCMTILDPLSESGMHFNFLVPVMDPPNLVVRFQDIIIPDGITTDVPYDEEALVIILEAKANAMASKIAAAASAATAVVSASAALVSQNAASASATSAGNSASAAIAEANDALQSADNAAVSAAAALVSKNSATASATTASTQAGIATTKAGETVISAAAALASQTSAATSATTATAQAVISTTQAGNSATSAAASAVSAASAIATVAVVSANPPVSPILGSEWIDSDTGKHYTWIQDTDGFQWVETYASQVVDNSLSPVNVKQFGAIGDGVADDTAAFQAMANLGGMGYIPKPVAHYNVSSIILTKSVSWTGDGDVSYVKRIANLDTASPTSSVASMLKITAHNCHYSFSKILFDGNEANQMAFEPCGYIARFSNVAGMFPSILSVHFYDCTFINATQACIAADGDTATTGYEELKVTNCRFIDGRNGLAQGNVNVASSSGYGPDYITLTDKVYATIVGNSFIFNRTLLTGEFSRTAIRITFDANTNNADGVRALIDGNYFYGCGRGERISGDRPINDVGVIDAYARGRELRIVNNLFEASQGTPIRGKTNCDLVYIAGNLIDDTNMNPGINIGPNSYAQQSGRITVAYNTIKNSAAFAIGVVGNAGATTSGPANTQLYVADVHISNNIVEGVTAWNPQLGPLVGEGIYSRNVKNLSILGNLIGTPAYRGIWLRGTGGTFNSENVTIANNRIDSSGLAGIETENSITGIVVITGNTVSLAGGWGFNIQSASGSGADLSYTNNMVSGSVDYGHYFRYWDNAVLLGNYVESVSGLSRGFYPQDSVTSVKVSFNAVGSGVTSPLVGAGVVQNVIADFGNSWNPKILNSTSVPTTGAWNRGDKIYNPSPSAGGFEGWLCVTSGTPGTWKTFGAITA